MMFSGQFFVLVKSLLLFCVVVAMCDAVQDAETVFHLH